MCSFISILSHILSFSGCSFNNFGGATEMANRFSNQSQENFLTRNGLYYFKPKIIFSWLLNVRTLLNLVYQISILFSTNLGN